MELVSVIIPVYNVFSYLSQCVDSVISQTYQTIEIILVDDGSTDESGKICDDYARKDKRISVIHQKNGGLSAARNTGIKNANGKYIFFVDSDDCIAKDTIEKMVSNQKVNNADVVICNFKYMNSNDNAKTESNLLRKSYTNWDTHTFWNYYFQSQYSFIFTIACNKLYKRRLLDNLRFPVGKLNEDDYFANSLFFKKLKINYINDELYVYRQRENSIMHSRKNVNNYDGIYAILKRADIFAQKGQTKFTKSCLNHALGLVSRKLRSNCLNKTQNYFNVLDEIKTRVLKYPNMKLIIKLFLINNMPLLYLKLVDSLHSSNR